MIRGQIDAVKLPVTRVDVCEDGRRPSRGWRCCRIGQKIKFDTKGLESYCFANWEPMIYDALLLTAAVDFCDRNTRRPAHGWGRQFDLRIPVHDPDRWSDNVSDLLHEVLSLLTGDRWHITFRPRVSAASVPRQGNFELPDLTSIIVPFSEGLDSHIASALVEQREKRKLVRVRLGAGRGNGKCANQPFASVPYSVKPDRYRFVESSARSRGFKFTMLSGIAAYLTKASEIMMPESGQGALGPVLVPVGHAYGDCRNYPRFTGKMAQFLTALLSHKVGFSFPRIWYTKGETLREYAMSFGNTWSDTRSCWQQSRQVSVNGHRRQCGICAACMLRRLSVHAAGLKERAETYVWENLSSPTFEQGAAPGFIRVTRALREYAIAGTLHLDHLAAISSSPQAIASSRRCASQIAAPLGLSPEEAMKRTDSLLSRHAEEWRVFVESLGPNSFVGKWAAAGR